MSLFGQTEITCKYKHLTSYFFCIFIEETELAEERTKKKKISWKERMAKIEKTWSDEKQNILSSMNCSFTLKSNCSICKIKEAVIKCIECRLDFCETCEQEIHEREPLHNRISFVDKCMEPLSPLQVLNEKYELDRVGKLFSILLFGHSNKHSLITKVLKF